MAAAAIVVAAACGGGSDDACTGEAELLAIQRGEGGAQSSVLTLRADGSCERRVAVGGSASWSPDGKRIAVGGEAAGRSIAVVDAKGQRLREIDVPRPLRNRAAAVEVAWSPDGRRIAFTREERSRRRAKRPFSLRVVPVDGGRTRKLFEGFGEATNPNSPSWTPEGGQIAFAMGSKEILTVGVAPGAGLTPVVSEGELGHPALSLEGQRLAYDRREGDRSRIVVAGAGGEDPRSVADGSEPAWSPDGKSLVFTTRSGLATSKADGSDQRDIELPRLCCARWRPEAG